MNLDDIDRDADLLLPEIRAAAGDDPSPQARIARILLHEYETCEEVGARIQNDPVYTAGHKTGIGVALELLYYAFKAAPGPFRDQ